MIGSVRVGVRARRVSEGASGDAAQGLAGSPGVEEPHGKGQGGEGGEALAEKVEAALQKKADFRYIYDEKETIPEKIGKIAREIYGAAGVDFTKEAQRELEELEALGFDKMPVCMAKTQYSLSDDAALLGRPEGFRITVRELRLAAGAGFVVALTGSILTMPGLPKHPAAMDMDITEDGRITGLF